MTTPQQGNLDIKLHPVPASDYMKILNKGDILPSTFRVLKGLFSGTGVAQTYAIIDQHTGVQMVLSPSDNVIYASMQSVGVTVGGATTFQLGLSAAPLGGVQQILTAGGVLVATLNGVGIINTAAPNVGANNYVTLTVGVNTIATNPNGISVFIIVAQ